MKHEDKNSALFEGQDVGDRGSDGERGISTILVVLLLVFFFIPIFVLTMDMSYVYYARGQLQNAADAGALAGTDLLDRNAGPGAQAEARAKAKELAEANFAAGSQVAVLYDGSDVLSAGNDITVGFWDVNVSTYTPGGSPANALQMRARRTTDSPEGPVGLFFGGIIEWPEMEVAGKAIAYRPPTPTTSMSFCIESCTELNVFPVRMHFKEQELPVDPVSGVTQVWQGIAWTEFTSSKATNFGPDSDIAKYIRDELPVTNVCDLFITTNNAAPQQIMNILKDEFDIQNALSGGNGWEVIAPVLFEGCPPGIQPDEPYLVTQYAQVLLTEVYNIATDPGIEISSIHCVSCSDPSLDELLGGKTRLVE